MLKLKKECAQCGDKSQMNVRRTYIREEDKVVFYICISCRESGNVDVSKLKMKRNKTYSNYE